MRVVVGHSYHLIFKTYLNINQEKYILIIL